MGWFSAKETIEATGSLVEKTGNAFDSLFTSDEERAAADILKQKIQLKPNEWAHQLNLINANSRNWFDSGWRPALGWVGAIGLAVYFIPQYALASILWVKAAWVAETLPAYPVSADGLFELVLLMFGNGVVRHLDKRNGVAR